MLTETRSLRLAAVVGVQTMCIRALSGVAFTHYLRTVIHRREWLQYSFRELLPRITLASLLMSCGMWLVSEMMQDWQTSLLALHPGGQFLQAAKMFQFLLLHFFWCSLWAVLYFGVHAEQRSRQQKIAFWKMQATLQEAQLLALKAQINPHFLFNALNSIQELMSEDIAKAREAVIKLSGVLRYSMNVGDKPLVTLREELDAVSNYLELERIRFDDRLKTLIDVDSGLLSERIPQMLLQTLVENAVKHGIAQLPNGGTLTLNIAREMERRREIMVCEITNSGTLNSPANSPTSGTGVGIPNTTERLRLLYGDVASFSLNEYGAYPETHVVARVAIPLENHNIALSGIPQSLEYKKKIKEQYE